MVIKHARVRTVPQGEDRRTYPMCCVGDRVLHARWKQARDGMQSGRVGLGGVLGGATAGHRRG
eukprot:723018-Lingulodinium_polyedra.AAC.1